jgi:hypothetical protein
MGWVGAPSVLTRLLIAVLTELMYCCSVWFWEASGAAAMTRTNGRENTFGNLRGFEYDIIDTGIPEGVQDWQADISQQ